jgi:hypothetical protein
MLPTVFAFMLRTVGPPQLASYLVVNSRCERGADCNDR